MKTHNKDFLAGLWGQMLPSQFHQLITITILSFLSLKAAALVQMVACLPLVQQVRGSIPCG